MLCAVCIFGGFILSLFLINILIQYFNAKNYRITDKTKILITGGCLGLGRLVALIFASRYKCHIIIFDILEPKSTDIGIYCSLATH